MEIHINTKSNTIEENVKSLKDLTKMLQEIKLSNMQGELTMKVDIVCHNV